MTCTYPDCTANAPDGALCRMHARWKRQEAASARINAKMRKRRAEALTNIPRKLPPLLAREAVCRYCVQPFAYTSRRLRSVCDSCGSHAAANHRHEAALSRPVTPPPAVDATPDFGAAIGYVCAASSGRCHVDECRHHLPSIDSCAVRVAGTGCTNFAPIGYVLGLTRERIRQIEARALSKLARNRGVTASGLRDAMGR